MECRPPREQSHTCEYAAAGQPEEVLKSPTFARIAMLLTWILDRRVRGHDGVVGDPAIVQGDATILDSRITLSFV